MAKDNEIKKVNSQKLLALQENKVGDLYFYKYGNGFYRITSIEQWKSNDKQTIIPFAHLMRTFDGIAWEKDPNHNRTNFLEMDDSTHKKVILEPGETYEQAIASLKNDLNNALLGNESSFFSDENNDEDEDDSDETGLMPVGGKTVYEDAAAQLMRVRNRAEIVAQLAERRMNQIKNIAYALEKKLKKVLKILMILEVYLGVNEEIFQITSGQSTDADEPISIRQLVLYMDEEAAIVKLYHGNFGYTIEGDINWKNVDMFDQWVQIPENLNIVLPEKKGVVALRASRQDRYGDMDPFSKTFNEENDRMIYLLIRNGDNLYRVWTNIKMGATIFPTQEQSEGIAKLFSSTSSWDKEKGEDAQQIWIRNALLIQGLIDRTPVFHPLPSKRIEMSKPETFEDGGPIRMIRDAEKLLTDGSLGYNEWKEMLNLKIKRGTRIYLPGVPWESSKDRDHRFVVYRAWGYPDNPDPGVYTVEEMMPRKYGGHDAMRILYSPGGSYFSWEREEVERTNRFSFIVYFSEVINYDDFDVNDIDRILKNRLDRIHYRTMMPTLIGLRDLRLRELAEEAMFVKLLSEKNDILEDDIWPCVDWWKKKVINKRPIENDNEKAWRMILSKAKKKGSV